MKIPTCIIFLLLPSAPSLAIQHTHGQEQEQHLHGQQDEDQSRAAEDHPENPPLALFQKVYPCFFGILFHNKPSLLEITKISANLMQQQFLTFIISLKSPI